MLGSPDYVGLFLQCKYEFQSSVRSVLRKDGSSVEKHCVLDYCKSQTCANRRVRCSSSTPIPESEKLK